MGLEHGVGFPVGSFTFLTASRYDPNIKRVSSWGSGRQTAAIISDEEIQLKISHVLHDLQENTRIKRKAERREGGELTERPEHGKVPSESRTQ